MKDNRTGQRDQNKSHINMAEYHCLKFCFNCSNANGLDHHGKYIMDLCSEELEELLFVYDNPKSLYFSPESVASL